MKKIIWDFIVFILLLAIAGSLITWDKEAIKALITGGVFGAWMIILLKKHWKK